MESPAPATPTAGEIVVGVFDRSDLGRALAATHRAGFGPNARVLDGARGDLAGQLRRSGLHVPLDPAWDATTALIVVTAPGRAARVLDVLARAGARAVHASPRHVAPALGEVAIPELPTATAATDEGAAAGS